MPLPNEPTDPTRAARLLLATWLTVTLPLLLVGGQGRPAAASGVPLGITAAHALSVALLLVPATRGGRTMRTALAWLPLLLVPVLYAELPWLMRGGFHDVAVQRWEGALVGEPARTLAARWPWPAASELLHLGYLSYYPVIYLPPALLWWRGRRRDFGATVLALVVTFVVCFGAYVAFPVQGPRYLHPSPEGIHLGLARRATLALLDRGSSRGAAFPSSHVAVAVTQAAMALALQPRLGWGIALCALLIGTGAVYGGFHYAVDVVAGALLGVLVASAVLASRRRAAPRG